MNETGIQVNQTGIQVSQFIEDDDVELSSLSFGMTPQIRKKPHRHASNCRPPGMRDQDWKPGAHLKDPMSPLRFHASDCSAQTDVITMKNTASQTLLVTGEDVFWKHIAILSKYQPTPKWWKEMYLLDEDKEWRGVYVEERRKMAEYRCRELLAWGQAVRRSIDAGEAWKFFTTLSGLDSMWHATNYLPPAVRDTRPVGVKEVVQMLLQIYFNSAGALMPGFPQCVLVVKEALKAIIFVPLDLEWLTDCPWAPFNAEEKCKLFLELQKLNISQREPEIIGNPKEHFIFQPITVPPYSPILGNAYVPPAEDNRGYLMLFPENSEQGKWYQELEQRAQTASRWRRKKMFFELLPHNLKPGVQDTYNPPLLQNVNWIGVPHKKESISVVRNNLRKEQGKENIYYAFPYHHCTNAAVNVGDGLSIRQTIITRIELTDHNDQWLPDGLTLQEEAERYLEADPRLYTEVDWQWRMGQLQGRSKLLGEEGKVRRVDPAHLLKYEQRARKKACEEGDESRWIDKYHELKWKDKLGDILRRAEAHKHTNARTSGGTEDGGWWT